MEVSGVAIPAGLSRTMAGGRHPPCATACLQQQRHTRAMDNGTGDPRRITSRRGTRDENKQKKKIKNNWRARPSFTARTTTVAGHHLWVAAKSRSAKFPQCEVPTSQPSLPHLRGRSSGPWMRFACGSRHWRVTEAGPAASRSAFDIAHWGVTLTPAGACRRRRRRRDLTI